MDVRHSVRSGPLEKNDRSLRRTREDRSLREQSPIRQRDCEVGVGFPFDHDGIVDAVVADSQPLNLDFEVVTLTKKAEQCRVPLSAVDAYAVARSLGSGADAALVVRRLPDTRAAFAVNQAWRGKPQVHGHIRAALAVGASRQEIADLITHVAFYAGFPSAGNAVRAAKEVFAELDGEDQP